MPKNNRKGNNPVGVIFFQGAFDIINAGHVRAFKLVRGQGNKLVIGLNSDSLCRWYKRDPIIPFDQRKEILESIRYIDEVVECQEPAAIRYLQQLDADVYACIDEWKEAQKEAIDWITSKGGKLFTPPYFPDRGVILSSSDIRRRIIERDKNTGAKK